MGMFEEQANRGMLVAQMLDLTGDQIDRMMRSLSDGDLPEDESVQQVIADFVQYHPSGVRGEPNQQLFMQSLVLMANEVMSLMLRWNEEFNG